MRRSGPDESDRCGGLSAAVSAESSRPAQRSRQASSLGFGELGVLRTPARPRPRPGMSGISEFETSSDLGSRGMLRRQHNMENQVETPAQKLRKMPKPGVSPETRPPFPISFAVEPSPRIRHSGWLPRLEPTNSATPPAPRPGSFAGRPISPFLHSSILRHLTRSRQQPRCRTARAEQRRLGRLQIPQKVANIPSCILCIAGSILYWTPAFSISKVQNNPPLIRTHTPSPPFGAVSPRTLGSLWLPPSGVS